MKKNTRKSKLQTEKNYKGKKLVAKKQYLVFLLPTEKIYPKNKFTVKKN